MVSNGISRYALGHSYNSWTHDAPLFHSCRQFAGNSVVEEYLTIRSERGLHFRDRDFRPDSRECGRAHDTSSMQREHYRVRLRIVDRLPRRPILIRKKLGVHLRLAARETRISATAT